MRAICFVTNIIEHGFDDNGRLIKTHIHYIGTGDLLNEFTPAANERLLELGLTYLRDNGRAKADTWVREHYDKVGGKTVAT
jgi:NTE family protein